MKIEGKKFENGSSISGVAFTKDGAKSELDRITIKDTYPEGEFGTVWVRNEESELIVIGDRGVGRVAIRSVVDSEVKVNIHDLIQDYASGNVGVVVPAGTWYALGKSPYDPDGSVDIVTAFTPPFDPEKQVVKTEEEIRRDEV